MHMPEKAEKYGWWLAEYARDGVFLISPEGVLLDANKATFRMYGYTREELIGMNILQIRRQDSMEKVREQMRMAYEESIMFETLHYRKDGSVMPVEVSSSGVELDCSNYIISVVRDITDRKKAEEEQRKVKSDLLRSNVCHMLLNEVTLRILNEEPLQETMELICRSLVNIYKLKLAWIGIKEADGIVAVKAGAGEMTDYLQDLQVCYDDRLQGQGPSGRSIKSGVTQVSRVDDPDFLPWRERALKFGFKTIAAVPLICGEKIIGSINLYADQDNYFDVGLIKQIEYFAGQTAMALGAAEKRRQMDLLFTVIEHAGDGIVVTDRNGVIEWGNPAFLRLSGYRAEEIVGQKTSLFKSGCQDQSFYQKMWQKILTGQVWRGELINRRKDGSLYVEEMSIAPVRDENNEIVSFVSVKQDVSERYEAQQKMQRSLDYYIQLFEDFPLLIWRSDQNGRMNYFNKKWFEFTGRSYETETDEGWINAVHPDDLKLCRMVYRENLQAQKDFSLEFRLLDHAKQYRWIVAMGMPFYDLEGNFSGHIGTCYDITDLREAEEERIKALKWAEKAERLASLGTMTASIAHEINQPLHAIKLTADGILYWQEKGRMIEAEKIAEAFYKISAAAGRIDNIIRNLRGIISGQVTLTAGCCDLNQAVYDALEMVGNQIEAHGIKLQRNLSETLPCVNADSKRLEEVVINLVINGMHELDKLQQEEKVISIETFKNGGDIVLEIGDNGPGVERNLREKIFEPFFTTKGAGNSMGLGLAIVNNIVRSMQGTIEIEDRAGGGALFRISLPGIATKTELKSMVKGVVEQ